MLHGLLQQLPASGREFRLHVRLYITENSSHREQELASRIRSEIVRGIAIFSSLEASVSEDPYQLAGFSNKELLYVERRPFASTNYMGFDYAHCATLMANTVIRKKFQNITLFTESEDYYDQKLFSDTFKHVVQSQSSCRIHHVQTSVSHGYSAAMSLFDSKVQPEAVFASNIVLAEQVKNMLYNFFDVKKTVVYTMSPLYTIPENQFYKFEMNYHLLGKHAAERLIQQLEAPAESEKAPKEAILPIEGRRIWAHYAEDCPRKKLTLLAHDSLSTEIIRNLANIYTKQFIFVPKYVNLAKNPQ